MPPRAPFSPSVIAVAAGAAQPNSVKALSPRRAGLCGFSLLPADERQANASRRLAAAIALACGLVGAAIAIIVWRDIVATSDVDARDRVHAEATTVALSVLE